LLWQALPFGCAHLLPLQVGAVGPFWQQSAGPLQPSPFHWQQSPPSQFCPQQSVSEAQMAVPGSLPFVMQQPPPSQPEKPAAQFAWPPQAALQRPLQLAHVPALQNWLPPHPSGHATPQMSVEGAQRLAQLVPGEQQAPPLHSV